MSERPVVHRARPFDGPSASRSQRSSVRSERRPTVGVARRGTASRLGAAHSSRDGRDFIDDPSTRARALARMFDGRATDGRPMHPRPSATTGSLQPSSPGASDEMASAARETVAARLRPRRARSGRGRRVAASSAAAVEFGPIASTRQPRWPAMQDPRRERALAVDAPRAWPAEHRASTGLTSAIRPAAGDASGWSDDVDR